MVQCIRAACFLSGRLLHGSLLLKQLPLHLKQVSVVCVEHLPRLSLIVMTPIHDGHDSTLLIQFMSESSDPSPEN